MKKYEVAVHGCDGSTIIEKEMTQEEYNFLKEVAQQITSTSSYGCMPIMLVKELEESE